MITGRKYIRSLNRYVDMVKDGEKFRVGIKFEEEDKNRLLQVGFSKELEVGESILPSNYGQFTKFNAEGKEESQRDKEKEILYRQQYQKRMELHGPDRVEAWGFIQIRYTRFPRLHIPAPSLELTIEQKEDCKYVMVNHEFAKENKEDTGYAILAINIMLEIFQRADLFTSNLDAFIKPAKLKRLNWMILPPGEKMPWDKRVKIYEDVVEFYLNVVGYKEETRKKGNDIVLSFYLNVVGYKAAELSSFFSIRIKFYMNEVRHRPLAIYWTHGIEKSMPCTSKSVSSSFVYPCANRQSFWCIGP